MKVYIDGKKFWEILGVPGGNSSLLALQDYSVLVVSDPSVGVSIVQNYVEPPPPDPAP